MLLNSLIAFYWYILLKLVLISEEYQQVLGLLSVCVYFSMFQLSRHVVSSPGLQ